MRPDLTALRGAVAAAIIVPLLITACAPEGQTPSPTPVPTSVPTPPPAAADLLVERYAAAWIADDYAAMHRLLAPGNAERYSPDAFAELHAGFTRLARAELVELALGEWRPTSLPPEPRPSDLPPPPPTPSPTPSPTPDPRIRATPSPTPEATPMPRPADPSAALAGPVHGIRAEVRLSFESDRFGSFALDRSVILTQGGDDWQLRWTPAVLFEELGEAGSFELEHRTPSRGRIVAEDGTIFAETREDGARVYPQEWLAGQVIGYVGEVREDELAELAEEGYEAGDLIGRAGLEAGAERQLRGVDGWILHAVDQEGQRTPVLEAELRDGADVVITISPQVQQVAQSSLSGYPQAATAAIDPRTGRVLALASTPLLNPNALTLGTTLGGAPLAAPSEAQLLNKALRGAYPVGSSFKPFTLLTALELGRVTPSSTVTCPPTWVYGGFRYRNYLGGSLAGQRTLAETMAFSCNTTYMMMAIDNLETDRTAFTNLAAAFGFGQPTGIGYIADEPGVLPDAAYIAEHAEREYGGHDQIQLAIGQGWFRGTPLQMANAYAAIANGGTLWTPQLVSRVELPDGTVLEEHQPTRLRQIHVAVEHLDFVTATLEAVVTLPFGTGRGAFAGFGIPVAGKSGTAETGTDAPHSWFPAFAPSRDARIAAATTLLYVPLATGGANAAPVVRQVMSTYFATE